MQVVAAKGQWRKKDRWEASQSYKGKDRKTTYDPRIRLEGEVENSE